MEKNVISKYVAKEQAALIRTSIIIQNGIYLADKKKIPSVDFYEDEVQYFDNKNYQIHLGIYGPLKYFEVETEEDYVSAVQYLFGHENQHVRSTAHLPYSKGIDQASKVIIEYIAAREGIKKIFRNDGDYDVVVKSELPKVGIYISTNVIFEICARIMNSVEDGRIERIRSLEFPGFEKQRRYFRAIVWNQDNNFKPYVELNANDRLNVMLNTILSLATTGLYPKEFISTYWGTPIMDEVKKFTPHVAKGVLAQRTRAMADEVVEIAKLLAPYIYDVCKYEKSDAEALLEELLKHMLSQMISNMDPSQMADTSEKEEETDDGIPLSVFPQSDLCITLDDETYDKMMEKMKESGKGSGGGIMIRREHPKEEEQQDNKDGKGSGDGSSSDKETDEEDGNAGSGSKSDKDGNEKRDGTSQSGDGNENDEKNNGNESDNKQNGGIGDQQSSNGEQVGDQNVNSKGKKKSDKKNKDNERESQPYSKEYSKNSGGSCNGNGNQGSHQSGGGEDGTVDMVLEQMEKAAAECRNNASELISNINQSVEHTAKNNRGCAPVVVDKDKPITQAEVKDICKSGFEEIKRKYKLDQQLPTVLNARAKAFRKKNERYFRSLSTPNVSHLDSGTIDATRIFGLALGETDVFKKIGNDKKFNGCVYVLVDNSGSMGGKKRMEAAKAAAVIEEGFKGIIPMKIVAFDTCGKVIHEVIKGWEESQKLNCCWNFAQHGRSGCGNDDAKDILVAQRELLARPEEKKLLIVLSDGAPSSIEQTKVAIEETRKKGISVFGIYFEEGRIGSDAKEFQYMYQKDYVCCELSAVDAELTRLMIKFSRS